jgi:hypothetical protein
MTRRAAPPLGLALVLAVPVAGCTHPAPPPGPRAAASGTAPVGSDADLPLPAASPVAPVAGVPAARAATLSAQLAAVWGVRVRAAGDSLHGSGADAPTGIRFTVDGRTRGAALRGYTCTSAPGSGSFGAPRSGRPDPAVMAALETALGFLQTCADASAADPDRATVWVRAVAQQALAGTPAARRIGGVRFRLERTGGGLRLTIGST